MFSFFFFFSEKLFFFSFSGSARLSQDLKGTPLSFPFGMLERRGNPLSQQRLPPSTSYNGVHPGGLTESHKVKALVMIELALSPCLNNMHHPLIEKRK